MKELKTKRLCITPQTDWQLEEQIRAETDDHMRGAMAQMLKGCKAYPNNRLWYTLWLIALKDGTVIGSLSFKGQPVDGAVEIGYGIKEPYQRQGYATEAVKAAIGWAFTNEKTYFVTAETEPDNKASQRVLEKAGFRLEGEGTEGPRFEKEKPPSSWMAVYMCLGVAVGISLGSSLGNMAIGTSLGLCIGVAIGSSLDAQDRKMRAQVKSARGKSGGEEK